MNEGDSEKPIGMEFDTSEFAPPFDPGLLSKMVLLGWSDVIDRYKTLDFKEIDTKVVNDPELAGKIICLPFGDRRTYISEHTGEKVDWGYHLGTDYMIPGKTPLFAIAKSWIVSAENYMRDEHDQNWGNLLLTKTPSGLTIFYAHLDFEPELIEKYKEGKMLEKGERIGEVAEGYTMANGNWPAHLHLQISKAGGTAGYAATEAELVNYVNPEELFKIGK